MAAAGQGKTRGQISYCLIDTYVNQSIIVLRTKESILKPLYLFYVLTGKYGELRNMSDANAIRGSITCKMLENFEVLVPNDVQIQETISNILYNYDSLILNNDRRILLLEMIAKLIYDEWFVKFKYPGFESSRMVSSVIGEIPDGWEVKKLGAICNVTMGQSPKSEYYNEKGEGLPFHQGVTGFGSRFPTNDIYCTVKNRLGYKGDILISVRAPVGRPNISLETIVIGRGLAALRHKDNLQSFLFYQLKRIFAKDDSFGGGTIFNAITKGDLHNLKVLVPNNSLDERFDSLLKPIDSEIFVLTMKNKNLMASRVFFCLDLSPEKLTFLD